MLLNNMQCKCGANAVQKMEKLGLNEREIEAVRYVVRKGSISNREYQQINKISKRIATEECSDLVKKGVFVRIGKGKRDINIFFQVKSIQKVSKKENEKNSEIKEDNILSRQKMSRSVKEGEDIINETFI